MEKREIIRVNSILIVFAMLLFAPIAVQADELDEPDSVYQAKKSYIESEEALKAVTNESETITDTTATFEGTYDTEEEATNKQTEKETEYSEAGYENIQSEITAITTEEETGNIIEEYTGSTTETEEEAYVFDTEEEANAKKEELEVDNHDKKVTVTITKRTVDSGEDEVTTITGQFNSVEEAEAYVAELEAQGYTVEYTVTQNSHEEEVTLEETYDTLAEAETALQEFKDTYAGADGVIEDVETEEVIEGPTTLDTPYETESEAETALQEYINNNAGDDYYYIGETTGPTGTGEYTEPENIEETFENKDAAEAYIAELEAEGYIVDAEFTNDTETQDVTLTNDKYGSQESAEAALAAFKEEHPNATWDEDETGITVVEAGTVYEAHTITEDMKVYQIGSTTYIIIKHGNEYFVWTEPELSSEEISQFKETFADLHTGHPVTGDNVANAHFVYGYNITYHTKNGKGFYFVLHDDNEINIVMDSGAESRVMYGTFEPVKQYVVNAKGTEEITLDTGTLKGTKKKEIEAYYNQVTKKVKKHKVTASGKETVLDDSYTLEGKKTKDIMKDEYVLDVTTETKNYKYIPETVEKTTYYLVVKADIPQENKKETPKEKITKKVVAVSENPQTADNVIKYMATLALSTLGLFFLAATNLKRKQN